MSTGSSSNEEQRTQSFELSVSVLATLMKVMDKSELSHASLPRQNTCLKLFAHLCRVFSKTDVLILRVKPLMQKSPVWALLSSDKKSIAAVTGKKEYPAQLAQLAAMFHGVRFHMSFGEQETMLELLFQAAFLPNCIASRHAAATLLSLFELSSEQAKNVVKALEWFLMKFRPTTLRVGDTLATIYLLRLCGQVSRLPTAADDQLSTGGSSSFSKEKSNKSISVSNLLDLSYDMGGSTPGSTGGAASPPPSPVARQRQRLDGVTVSNSLAARLKDMLLDVLCAASEQKTATTTASTWVSNAVVLVAIEETVKDSDAESCFMKVRGSVCVFEIVASLLLKMLREAGTANNVVMLHRLCRVTQFTAECLDGAVLQMTGSAHQPQFLDKITERVVDSASHGNPFIACESLRALVWLLPRLASNAPSGWELLMKRLMDLPMEHQISPESRVAISEAFFHRAVTNPSLNQHQIDMELLKKCLLVTLSWFQTAPCEWHAAMLVRIWQTALRKSLAAMGDDVFRSINIVLDFQHHQHHLKATTELVKRSTLDFLLRLGAKFAIHRPSWFQALSLRLTKQMLLESLISRRLSVQVMLQLDREAQQLRKMDIVQQITMLMAYLKQVDPADSDNNDNLNQHGQQTKRKPDVFVETKIQSESVKDSLGIHDLVLQAGLEARAPSIAARPGALSSAMAANPFFNGAPIAAAATTSAMAFDGVF